MAENNHVHGTIPIFLANLSILVVWKQYIFILRRTRNMSCYMLEDVSMHVVFRVLVLKLYIN